MSQIAVANITEVGRKRADEAFDACDSEPLPGLAHAGAEASHHTVDLVVPTALSRLNRPELVSLALANGKSYAEIAAMTVPELKAMLICIRAELKKQLKTVPQSVSCPLCTSIMCERTNNATHEKFWGCQLFPECKGTRRIAVSE